MGNFKKWGWDPSNGVMILKWGLIPLYGLCKLPEIPGTHFINLGRMKGLSRPWSHPVALNTGPLDWESSGLTKWLLLN